MFPHQSPPPPEGRGGSSIPPLWPGQRVTLGLWRRSARELPAVAGHGCLPEAAAHALLAMLWGCTQPLALFDWYDSSEQDDVDFALIGSLVPGDLTSELWWKVRDTAYHLRWRELATPTRRAAG